MSTLKTFVSIATFTILLITNFGCATKSAISNKVVNAIALCSAGLAKSDAGILSARLISVDANIQGELTKIEQGTLDLSDVEMYKQYLICVDQTYNANRNTSKVVSESTKKSSKSESNDTSINKVVSTKGFDFLLKKCSTIDPIWSQCSISIKNNYNSDQRIRVYSDHRGKFSAIYGSNGDQIKSSRVTFGALNDNDFVAQVIPSGLLINAKFTFKNFSKGMNPGKLRVIIMNESTRESFPVLLDNIIIL